MATSFESSAPRTELSDRIASVRANIATAAERCGRRPDEITLVGASKTVSPRVIAEAAASGLLDFGENWIQEAEPKIAELAEESSLPIRWHFIGHLQSNKARGAIRLFAMIQSVDSLRLAHTLSRLGQELASDVSVLLEVNIGAEPSKFGFTPDTLRRAFPELAALPNLRLSGLMTVAPEVELPEQARSFFRALRELRDELAPQIPAGSLRQLSMGMTGDYSVAVEEGSTMVRVGRAIFGERPTTG